MMVIEKVAEVLSCGLPESFTVTLMLGYVPFDPTGGIPVIAPVAELIASPDGNPDAVHA
jgi:hypothetical protein